MDLIFVWSGTLVGAFAGMIAQVLIARTLGVQDYGVLSSAQGLVALAVSLGVFGIAQYWLKAFGEEGWKARRWLRSSLKFLAASTASIVAVLALWAAFGPHNDSTQFVLLLLLATIIAGVSIEAVSAKLQLEHRFAVFAALGATTSLARLLVALAVYFVLVEGDVLWLTAIGYMGTSIAIFGLLIPQLRRLWNREIALKGHLVDPGDHAGADASVGVLVSHSWVFGVAGLLYLAWAQGHIVVANYALGSYDAGIYSAALVLLNAICLLPTAAFSKFLLPKIHRWASQDFEKLRNFNRLGSAFMFAIGVLTALAIYFGAPLLVRLSFGQGYETTASVLQILSLTIPMRFLGYNAGAMLRTKHFMQIKIVILTTAVAFNLGLAALLIPTWGLLGLAATVPATEFLLVSAYVYFVEARYFRLSVSGG